MATAAPALLTTDLDAWSVATPIGRLSVLAEGDLVVASGFDLDESVLQRGLSKRRSGMAIKPRRHLGAISDAARAYFDGDIDALDAVMVDQDGTLFLLDAWDALRGVPAGTTVTYSELAAKAGRPRAVRAAASACARNKVAPFVPCHRVVASVGIGGYGYGLDSKRWLLAHEGVLL